MRANILLGKGEIMDYLKISDETLNKLIQAGLPAKKIGTTWAAHTENIEMFFKEVTKDRYKEPVRGEGPAPAQKKASSINKLTPLIVK